MASRVAVADPAVAGRRLAAPAGGAGGSPDRRSTRRDKAAVAALVAGGRGGNQGDAAFNARYMMELFVTADNVFNRVNYGGYSGNLLSGLLRTADDGAAPAAGAGRDAVPVLVRLRLSGSGLWRTRAEGP